MKTIVLMPVIDWPIGCGDPHHFMEHSIASVFEHGPSDTELWVGLDGDLPRVEARALASGGKRTRTFKFPATRTLGNYQRREMMKLLPESCLFAFMDQDDAYCDHGLEFLHEMSVNFGGVPVSAHLKHSLFHELNNRLYRLEAVSGQMTSWNGTQACIFPSALGMPLWGESSDSIEDYNFCKKAFDWHAASGRECVISPVRVAIVRPWSREWVAIA